MNTLYIAKPSDSATEKALIAILDTLKIDYDLNENGDNTYSKTFTMKILESKRQIENGEYTEVNFDELDKYLGLS
jgi:hypothetical protein